MAEPKRFQFDSNQRVATPARRRGVWLWIAVSLALHGAIVLFALVGAARGGNVERAGTFEVQLAGPPSAGDPDGGEQAEKREVPAAVPRRPDAPPIIAPAPYLARPSRAPSPGVAAPNAAPESKPAPRPETTDAPDPIALPRKATPARAAPSEPRPDRSETSPQPTAASAAPPPMLARPKAAREAKPPPAAAPRGIKKVPEGQTASLGTPNGGVHLGRADTDDTGGMLNVNLNPRFRVPPAPPLYPRQSIERDEEGVVLVRALVDPAGAPQRVLVFKSSGFPLLDDAALAAVRNWRFEPMIRAGRAAAAWVQVPVRFRLN